MMMIIEALSGLLDFILVLSLFVVFGVVVIFSTSIAESIPALLHRFPLHSAAFRQCLCHTLIFVCEKY